MMSIISDSDRRYSALIEGFPLKVENDRNLFEARNCRFFDASKARTRKGEQTKEKSERKGRSMATLRI